MKKLITLIVFISTLTYAQTPCVNGMAGQYPCNNLDLLSHIPLNTFNATRGNDSWGWTDPDTGKEYVIFGNTHNAAFIDISDPINPIYLGKLMATNNSNSTWRDIKVYNNYAFIVSEAGGHGMQIFDLTRLRNVANPPEIFTEDTHYSGFGSAHNIVINEETGYAYAVGADVYSGGPHFINIQDPLNPIGEGGYSGKGYSHDAQVIVYNGPDTDHTGKEIYIGANASRISIIDVTNKANPQPISDIIYSGVEYTHQAWLDSDQVYLYCGDELDEYYNGGNTRALAFDLTDLDNPTIKNEYFGPTTAIDHNNYVINDKLYLANYNAGMRIIDVADIANGNMSELAYFDSHPENDAPNFDGVWNVYPFFASGNIMISDRDRGVFIVRDSNSPLGVNSESLNTFSIYPNPSNKEIKINYNNEIKSIDIYNIIGKRVKSIKQINTIDSYKFNIENLNAGIYFIKLNNLHTQKFVKL